MSNKGILIINSLKQCTNSPPPFWAIKARLFIDTCKLETCFLTTFLPFLPNNTIICLWSRKAAVLNLGYLYPLKYGSRLQGLHNKSKLVNKIVLALFFDLGVPKHQKVEKHKTMKWLLYCGQIHFIIPRVQWVCLACVNAWYDHCYIVNVIIFNMTEITIKSGC